MPASPGSSAPHPPGSLAEVLARVAAALDGSGFVWVIIGAQALAAHGVARSTADVDLIVGAGRDQGGRVHEALARAGFRLLIAEEDRDAFVAETAVLPYSVPGSPWSVDAILGQSTLDALFLERATPRPVGGVFVPVLSLAHLIVSKVLAGRPKDDEDLRRLSMVAPARAMWDEADLLLAELEAALEVSDLRPRLRALRPAVP
jgi:hypothetical protein